MAVNINFMILWDMMKFVFNNFSPLHAGLQYNTQTYCTMHFFKLIIIPFPFVSYNNACIM